MRAATRLANTNASGEHCVTLTVTDSATGWTGNRSVRNKAEKWVFEALQHGMGVFSFPIIGIDSDYANIRIMPTWSRQPLAMAEVGQ
jgi:hypothetical protein